MKLYRKKLGSLEELKREKIRLRYERMHTKASDLNPIAEIGRGKVSGPAKAGIIGTLIALASSKSQMHTAIAIGKPLMRMISKRRARKMALKQAVSGHRKPSMAKRIFTEIAVSYIIGKALQVSVSGLRAYMKRRKRSKLTSS